MNYKRKYQIFAENVCKHKKIPATINSMQIKIIGLQILTTTNHAFTVSTKSNSMGALHIRCQRNRNSSNFCRI